MSGTLEHQFIIRWISWFQQKHLYEGTTLLSEMYTCLYHLCIIKYHQSTLWKIFRKIIKDVFANLAMFINQQFRMVTLWKWIFRYPLIWKRIIVVTYLYMFCIHISIVFK